MDPQTILVIGATGVAGAPVARQLREQGYRVRLLVRDSAQAASQFGPDFVYVEGRVEDREALARALHGCVGVHLSLQAGSNPADIERVEHQGALSVIELAAQERVQHITYVSGMLVGAEISVSVRADQAKVRVEEALKQSSIPFTIFRPSYFMDNLPKHIQGNRAMVLGSQPHPLHIAAASDFGRMVAHAFQLAEADNKVFYVQGPEALTLKHALSLYCAMLAPQKRVMVMPLWAMSLVDPLFMGGKMRRTLEIMRVMQRYGEFGDPVEANRILGAPTTTLRVWCEGQQGQRA